LSNFKNIEQADLDCSPVLNCFVGNNGEGKTNLLDGIYYLSMCRSKFVSSDSINIRNSEDYFLLKGKYVRMNESLDEDCASCGVKRSGRKSFKYNSKEYRKLSDHIGVVPLVFITPSDNAMITDGSEERRKFLNTLISQTDKVYLDSLLRYNNVLMNRNKHLKNSRNIPVDLSLMETMNHHLNHYGSIVYEKRREMVETLLPLFRQIYSAIANNKEEIDIAYRSDLDQNDLTTLLDRNFERDRILQYTSTGIHRDDLLLEIDGRSLKNSGSQGQQKTFIIAMKIAQFSIIKNNTGLSPILLLDDIFDKLDVERVERLISFVTGNGFGQIFLTDSNKNRLDRLLQKNSTDYKLFSVEAGNVKLIQSS
jgi:DNA replication and repair protein RecF